MTSSIQKLVALEADTRAKKLMVYGNLHGPGQICAQVEDHFITDMDPWLITPARRSCSDNRYI